VKRELFTRVTAGAISVLGFLSMGMGLVEGWLFGPWFMDYLAIPGMLIMNIAFGAYALFGESAFYRVARWMHVYHLLPEAVFGWAFNLLKVEIPDDWLGPLQDKGELSGPDDEPVSASGEKHDP